jgi:hypothetical protein
MRPKLTIPGIHTPSIVVAAAISRDLRRVPLHLPAAQHFLRRSGAAARARRGDRDPLLVVALFRLLRDGNILSRAGWLLLAAGAILGVILIKTGTSRTEWKWLYLHILISLFGVGLLIADQLGKRGWLKANIGGQP